MMKSTGMVWRKRLAMKRNMRQRRTERLRVRLRLRTETLDAWLLILIILVISFALFRPFCRVEPHMLVRMIVQNRRIPSLYARLNGIDARVKVDGDHRHLIH